MAGTFYLGISGFADPEGTHGVLYPEGLKDGEMAGCYASRSLSVEINHTFRRPDPAEGTLRRRAPVGVLALVLALVLAGCSGGAENTASGSSTSSPSPSASAISPSPTPAHTPFCRNLLRLDARLRSVRSYEDANASLGRYQKDAVALDLLYRKVRDTAPADLDLAPIEFANGRFGEIVRGFPPDLPGALARAQVAINLESYATAVYAALVKGCGPGAVGAG